MAVLIEDIISKRMRVFKAVADIGNFTKAANAMHMTQPAVTFQIKNLESQLGAPVFIRHNNTITITEIGKHFLDTVNMTMKLLEGRQKTLQTILQKGAEPMELADLTREAKIRALADARSSVPDSVLEKLVAESGTKFDYTGGVMP